MVLFAQSPSLSNNSSLQAPLFESHWHTGRFTIQVVQTRSVDKFKKKKVMGKSTGNTDFQKVGEKKEKN